MFGRGGSIQLARISGIRIGVDPSWFFVLFLIIWILGDDYATYYDSTTAYILSVASALLFFLSILLHELGHAVAARRSGIGIEGIDLWMFGGVAKLSRDTRSAGEEFKVAVAGPVVTLIIALACFGAAVLITSPNDALDATLFEDNGRNEVLTVLGYLASINALLLFFNLIPAFPLDGGRIARAIAWWRTGDRGRATRLAARMGRGFSFVMIGGGIFLALQGWLVTGIWLGIIGVFLGQAAKSAELQSVLTDRLGALLVSDVMDAEPVAIPADLTLDRAENEFFLRYGYPWFPVIDDGGRFVGLITQASFEGLPDAVRSGRTVSSVMAADAGEGQSRMRVAADAPLETLLGLEGLVRLGAIMAVDGEGRLRGIVTADAVNRALTTA